MRTRENTRKCTQLRDKQKSMIAGIVRDVVGTKAGLKRNQNATKTGPNELQRAAHEPMRYSFRPGTPTPA
jgi:hypothetical protein